MVVEREGYAKQIFMSKSYKVGMGWCGVFVEIEGVAKQLLAHVLQGENESFRSVC